MKRRRTPDELGALGGIEGVVFGILLFVGGTLTIAYAWNVIDAKIATSAAAREAARAYVESVNGTDAASSATDAAADALAGYNRPVMSITFDGDTGFGRCSAIRVHVSTAVPKLSTPIGGSAGGQTIVASDHTEVVDPYTSGVSGKSAC